MVAQATLFFPSLGLTTSQQADGNGRQAPVGEREGIAELPDALEVGGVASDQGQPVVAGDRGDQRIILTDWLPGSSEVAQDPAAKRSRIEIKGEHLDPGHPFEKAADYRSTLDPLQAAHHLDDRQG